MKLKDFLMIAMLATISIVLEEIMTFLPNIQFTFFLFILYSKVLGFKKTSLIIVIHTLIDSLLMGFQVLYFVPMLFSYLLIPSTLSFIKTDNAICLSLLSVVYSLIYCWMFLLATIILTSTPAWEYFIADIPFELLLMGSSFISTLWLYPPLSKQLKRLYTNYRLPDGKQE